MCVWLSGCVLCVQLVTFVLYVCCCAVCSNVTNFFVSTFPGHFFLCFLVLTFFLILSRSLPFLFFFLFLQKEIVLFLNDLTICQILELSIAWRWIENKNSIRIKEYRGRTKKSSRGRSHFFFRTRSGIWIGSGLTRTDHNPIGFVNFKPIGFQSRPDPTRTRNLSGRVGSDRVKCPPLDSGSTFIGAIFAIL